MPDLKDVYSHLVQRDLYYACLELQFSVLGFVPLWATQIVMLPQPTASILYFIFAFALTDFISK